MYDDIPCYIKAHFDYEYYDLISIDKTEKGIHEEFLSVPLQDINVMVEVEKIGITNDAAHNNFPIGYTKKGLLVHAPVINGRIELLSNSYFSTSLIKEIYDVHTIKTLNSIYKIHLIDSI